MTKNKNQDTVYNLISNMSSGIVREIKQNELLKNELGAYLKADVIYYKDIDNLAKKWLDDPQYGFDIDTEKGEAFDFSKLLLNLGISSYITGEKLKKGYKMQNTSQSDLKFTKIKD